MPAMRSCLSGYSCILFLGSTAGATQQFVSPKTWTMLFWKEYLGSTINCSVYLHCSAFNLEAEAKRVFCGLTFVHRNWEEERGQKENTYWAMVVIKFHVSSIYLSNLSEHNIEMNTVLMFQNQLRYVANRKYTRLTSDVWADTVGGKTLYISGQVHRQLRISVSKTLLVNKDFLIRLLISIRCQFWYNC